MMGLMILRSLGLSVGTSLANAYESVLISR